MGLGKVNLITLQQLSNTEFQAGEQIDVSRAKTVTLFMNYTQGDETSVDIIPNFLPITDGTTIPFGEWSNATTATYSDRVFQLTASDNAYLTLDVEGHNVLAIRLGTTGGTPAGQGTMTIDYIAHNPAINRY